MILYHYRSIERALTEIGDGTFYFATHNELNDPIEGYIKVFWMGDKFAWEGLLRNYIYNIALAILEHLSGRDMLYVSHKSSLLINVNILNNMQLEETLNDLGATFLADNEIQDLTTFYGQQRLEINEEGLRIILYLVHHKALKLCIAKYLELNLIPKEIADNVLRLLAHDKMPRLPFDKMNENPPVSQLINIISQIGIGLLDDELELRYIKNNIFSEEKQRRNWMAIFVDFPKSYIQQLKDMIYPENFVVCFSSKNNNSAMWGNYADHHKGVCLIYETDKDDIIKIKQGRDTFTLKAKPILYEGDLVKRNFFETFGRLTRAEVKTWLTGADGSISSSFEVFEDENQWRNEYWKMCEMKNYHKLKAWKDEQEYRIILSSTFYDFSTPESRILKYDPKCLKGVIFGLSTSEPDKKQIMDKLLENKDNYTNFTFYQAEFDDEKQSITIREKQGWEI